MFVKLGLKGFLNCIKAAYLILIEKKIKYLRIYMFVISFYVKTFTISVSNKILIFCNY